MHDARARTHQRRNDFESTAANDKNSTLYIHKIHAEYNMDTANINSIPDCIKHLVFDLLDGPSWGSLRQVLDGFSVPLRQIRKHTTNYAMNKFSIALIGDIQMMVRDAETYTEVAMRCRTMAEDAMDPGMVNDERWMAYEFLLDQILDRAADTIAYSQDCTLEGAGSKDFDRIWSLVEAEAY